jgi:hypothetical protein
MGYTRSSSVESPEKMHTSGFFCANLILRQINEETLVWAVTFYSYLLRTFAFCNVFLFYSYTLFRGLVICEMVSKALAVWGGLHQARVSDGN